MEIINKNYPDVVPIADIKQQAINNTFEFYKIVENENTNLTRYNKCLIMLLEEIDKNISAKFKRLSRLYWQNDYDTIKAEVKPLIDKFEAKRDELISKGMKSAYNAEDYCIYTYLFFLYNSILELTFTKPTSTCKLTLAQVALKYIYEGKQININNADDIVKEYGHTSGLKLYQHYLKYFKPKERTSDPGSPRKLKAKIDLFESMLSIMDGKYKEEIAGECNILKSKLI